MARLGEREGGWHVAGHMAHGAWRMAHGSGHMAELAPRQHDTIRSLLVSEVARALSTIAWIVVHATSLARREHLPASDYDVIIVGARCAGATLATFLARAGASVLLLDRDRLPSDHVLSTHGIHPLGMDVLDEVGVGAAVRAIAPRIEVIRINQQGVVVDMLLPDGRAEYCPRRKRLDDLLQRAAVASGAELRDRTRVTAMIRDGDRAVGVRAITDGREWSVNAPLVIGADGRRSTIARLVAAEEYLAYDAPRALYWGYWRAPALWKSESYPFGMYFGYLGKLRAIFETDHDQLLIASSPPLSEAASWRASPEAALTADLRLDPFIEPLLAESTLDGRVRGTIKERYFFRRGVGAGWALLGDAGHHKEFALGDGITEALLQARSLAAAVSEGSDLALERWWRARDVAAVPLHFFGQDSASLNPPAAMLRIIFERVAAEPRLAVRLAAVMERQLSPYEVLPAATAMQWILAAVLRGNVAVLRELLGMAGRISLMKRELRAREKLLAECEAAARAGALPRAA